MLYSTLLYTDATHTDGTSHGDSCRVETHVPLSATVAVHVDITPVSGSVRECLASSSSYHHHLRPLVAPSHTAVSASVWDYYNMDV